MKCHDLKTACRCQKLEPIWQNLHRAPLWPSKEGFNRPTLKPWRNQASQQHIFHNSTLNVLKGCRKKKTYSPAVNLTQMLRLIPWNCRLSAFNSGSTQQQSYSGTGRSPCTRPAIQKQFWDKHLCHSPHTFTAGICKIVDYCIGVLDNKTYTYVTRAQTRGIDRQSGYSLIT